MAIVTKVSTGNQYESLLSYSRLVKVDNWIYVSNTAGRNPETQEIPEDPAEQTMHVINNIARALAAVDATLADVVASRIFIQNPEDTRAVMTCVGERFRGINPAMTMTCPPLGSTIYKVEIEVTAWLGAGKAETTTIMLN
ncbi:RidA family protein [Mangrovibacter sp. SLW1]